MGELNSVGCGSTTACTAVGSSIDGSLGEDWNGTAWSLDSTVNPGGGSTSLSGDWCTSSTTCIAVGYGNGGMISETRNGSSWSVQPIALPSGDSSAYLNQVSCSSASACTAVGWQYNSTSNESTPLAERWNGTSWSPQSVPMPAGATSADLNYVWCTGAAACAAVGYGDGTSEVPLAEAWSGKAWKVQKTPVPAGATGAWFSGVSCPSTGACEAVGSSISNSGDEQTLAERLLSSTWTVQPTPNVGSTSYDTLNSVSCTSTTTCMAVGQSSNGALSERWNGSAWSVESVPAPSDQEGTSAGLTDLACPSSSSCMAVGSYENTNDCEVPLGESWNGSAWAVQPTLSPVALTGYGGLPSGTVGESYSSTISVCGGPGPYTWSSSGALPNGLTLNTSTGAISGTPHYAGTSTFTVTVAQSSDSANSASASESIEIDSPKAPTNWPLDVGEAPPPPSGNTGPVLVNPEIAYILVGSWWCPLFGSSGPVTDPTDTACSSGSGGSAVEQSADMIALSNLAGTDYRSAGYGYDLSQFYEVQSGTTTYVGNFGPEPLYSPYGTVWAGALKPGTFTINDSFLKRVASGFGLSSTQAANTVFVFLYAPDLLKCAGTNNGRTSDDAYSYANVYLEDASDNCPAGKPYVSMDPTFPADFATFAVSHEIDEAVTDPSGNLNSWIIPNSTGTWQIADVCQLRNAEGDTSPKGSSYPYYNMTRDSLGTVVAAYVTPFGPPYTCAPSSGTGIPPH